MYWEVKRKLEEAGYNHYEISNFAKEGCESKHNLDCWNQKEYLGFGLAAHSYMNDQRYSNVSDFNKYINNNQEKVIHEIQDKESKMKEYMLLGLRKIEGISISEFENKFAKNPLNLYKEELSELEKQGRINVSKNQIKLTNKGIDFANQVWEYFL